MGRKKISVIGAGNVGATVANKVAEMEVGDVVVVDEGLIIIDGEDVIPFYLNAGKIYVPFGNFESHFISDPLTLELGETRESAVKVGFANDMFDLCMAVFNGDINETDEDDDHIESWVASGTFTLPEGAVSGLGLMVGVELKEKVRPHLEALLERGVLALPAGNTVLRLLPPLVIEYTDLDTVADELAEVLAD